MAQDALAEVPLVFPLDFRHFEQAVDVFDMAASGGEPGRHLVLDDVPAFEKARAVHGREPAGHGTQWSEDAADEPKHAFPHPVRSRPQFAEDSADQLPVMPLFRFDGLDALAFPRVTDASPVSGVSQARGQFARVGSLEDSNQRKARAVLGRFHCARDSS